MSSLPRRYTVQEVAEAYALPPKSIRDRIRKQHLKAINIGSDRKKEYRITQAALDEYERLNASA